MNTLLKSLATFLLLVGLNACRGTSSGNPPKTNIAVTATSQALPVASNFFLEFFFPAAWALPISGVVDSQGNSVSVSEAWLSLKNIRIDFEGDASCDDSRLVGPFVIDLLSNSATLLSEVQLDSQVDEVRWDLEKVASGELPSGAPAALEDNSFLIEARVNAMNSFTFLSDESTSMRFENEAFAATGSNLVVNILLKELFSKIDLDTIVDGEEISSANPHATAGSACPDINPSSNNLYSCFREGLENISVLGRDDNGDFISDD